MQRFIRGLMLAGTAVVAWGCADNPISDGAGDPADIVASPNSIFMSPNDTVLTTVEVLDSRGAALESDFAILNVQPGIDAVIDSSYNNRYDADGNLVPPTTPTRLRVQVISGASFGEFTFDVAGGGLTSTVDVRVLPTQAAITSSTATAQAGEVFTLTTSAPFLFGPNAVAVANSGIELETVSIAPDGSSMEVRASAPHTGDLTIDGIQVDFIPGVDLALASTGGALDLVGLPGTDAADIGLIPVIPTPAVGAGNSTSLFDFGTMVDQFYAFDVTAGDTLIVNFNWDLPGGTDIDVALVDPTFSSASCVACTGNHPEQFTFIAPTTDTYFLWAMIYAGDAPAQYIITLSRPEADED